MSDQTSKGKGLLARWLQKLGIDKEVDMSVEERATYDKYRQILTGEATTVESLKKFMRAQVSIIEEKFGNASTEHDTYYKACIHVYLSLLRTIEAPEAEREALERHLVQLISNQ